MSLKGTLPPEGHTDQGFKRKRGRHQQDGTAGSSFESPNYFAVLSDSASDTETIESVNRQSPRKYRIPPIVLYSYLTNHSATIQAVNEKLTSPVEVKTKTNRLLLYTKSEGDYSVLLQEIKKVNIAFHTYPLPTKVQPRVALKGIPPTVDVAEIQDELEQKRLNVVKIRQIVRMDKNTVQIQHKFPVFIVTFQAGTDLSEVYKITKVCQCIIRWEKYKKPRPVQQCFKCQTFGHSSYYCGRPTRCVKCDGHHSTKDCPKPTTAQRKCVNCGGEHPANHEGCPEYIKRLETRRRRISSPSTGTSQIPPASSQFPPLRSPPMANRKSSTWAQVASKPHPPLDTTSFPSLVDSVKSILTSFNLHSIGATLRTLALRLQETRNPMDKIILLVDTILGYFVPAP
jgi:hypothetical protein